MRIRAKWNTKYSSELMDDINQVHKLYSTRNQSDKHHSRCFIWIDKLTWKCLQLFRRVREAQDLLMPTHVFVRCDPHFNCVHRKIRVNWLRVQQFYFASLLLAFLFLLIWSSSRQRWTCMVSQCTQIVVCKIVYKQTHANEKWKRRWRRKRAACVKCESLQCLPLQIAALSWYIQCEKWIRALVRFGNSRKFHVVVCIRCECFVGLFVHHSHPFPIDLVRSLFQCLLQIEAAKLAAASIHRT